jgi:uncharacterized protein YkwD/LysM repeat protein
MSLTLGTKFPFSKTVIIACMRKYLSAFILLILVLALFVLLGTVEAHPAVSPRQSSAYELIDAVNALRADRGLPPYQPNAILMQIAQQQADYILSIGTGTHYSADGLRPFQRALQAGYAVAGDLSLGGWFSENIVGGVGKTAEAAVEQWTGDDPHLNTMISPNLVDIGAGVAVSDNTYYYVIDCGRSTGGTPATFIPPPTYKTAVATIIPNTPNPDGTITYIVQPGDTMLGIAIAYNISLGTLYALNNLTENSIIYPEQVIIIQAGNTITPSPPTSTPTGRPSSTPWPVSTKVTAVSAPTSSATSVPVLPSTSAGGAVIAIIVAALVAAAILTFVGAGKKAGK